MLRETIVSAPGKIIISGEHAVVHGYPALVAATDKRIQVSLKRVESKKLSVYPSESEIFVKDAVRFLQAKLGFLPKGTKIKISSEIPIGRGMGSSAAFAVAISKALPTYIEKSSGLETVSDLAYELEKKYHGNPSGVDIAVSVYGSVLWFRKETREFKVFSKVKPKNEFHGIYLLDSGKPKETTKETVAYVSQRLKTKPRQTEKVFKEIELVTRGFLQYITGEKSYGLRQLFKENERLLEKLGVVSDSTIKLINQIEKIGGAAKISGAGGIRGASGIILVYHPDREKLFSFMKRTKYNLEKVRIGEKGVQLERTG